MKTKYNEAEILDRKDRFMRIRATAHQIHMFIQHHGLGRGVTWMGSNKSDMAQAYATGYSYGGTSGPVLPESTIEKLEEKYGSRPKRKSGLSSCRICGRHHGNSLLSIKVHR